MTVLFSRKITKEAIIFSKRWDRNSAHTGSKNEILNENSVSGIYLFTIINEAILANRDFGLILCAKSFNAEFKNPVFVGDSIRCEYKSKDKPHNKRPGVIIRNVNYKIFSNETDELSSEFNVIYYPR